MRENWVKPRESPNGHLKYSFLLNLKLGSKQPFVTTAEMVAEQDRMKPNSGLVKTAI
jgi:hypothetical protein